MLIEIVYICGANSIIATIFVSKLLQNFYVVLCYV